MVSLLVAPCKLVYSTMYELVRTQLYLNMVQGVVIYYQLHVSASILAIIRFTIRFNLLRELYKLYGVLICIVLLISLSVM